MINKIENKYFLKILSLIFILIPFTLITGPFLPDLFAVIIILSLFSYSFYNKNFLIFNNKILIFCLFICLYFTIVSFFSQNFISIKSSIFYFRFVVFAFLASYLISCNKDILKKLFFFLIIYFLFGILFQYFFQKIYLAVIIW